MGRRVRSGRDEQARGDRSGPEDAPPLSLVPRTAPVGGPVIEITPTPDEYDQLVRDLALLRDRGAPSNTAAVVESVHAAAGARIGHGKHEKAGRR